MTPDLSDVVLTRAARPGGDGMSIAEAVAAQAGEALADPRDGPSCASAVLMGWMITWGDCLDDDDRQALRQYIAPLAMSWGTPEQETTRVWLVIDWLIRSNAAVWLTALGLSAHAATLTSLRPVRYPYDLADAHQAVRDGARAARDSSERVWRLVAENAHITIQPAQPEDVGLLPTAAVGPHEPAKARRLETWALVADSTTTALDNAQTLVDCATSAVGYRTAAAGDLPEGLRTIANLITSAATGIAWGAVHAATNQATWSWEAGADAASTARQAATSALRASEIAVRESAHGLMGRMLQ